MFGSFLSTLPLFVAGVFTQDPDNTLAAHDLALITHLLDACPDLHFDL
jgi:hypothetical protein